MDSSKRLSVRAGQTGRATSVAREPVEVVWARTGERGWRDRRPRDADDSTLRQRLGIPVDQDLDDEALVEEVNGAAAAPTASSGDAPHDEQATEATPSAPVTRGDVSVVVDEITSSEHSCLLLTDVNDPELALLGAHDVACELTRRGESVVHLHVGPAREGEPTLADAGPDDEAATRQVEVAPEIRYLTITSGAVEKAAVAVVLDRLRDDHDRVIVTGTGSGIDSRQTRLASLTDAVITRDDAGETNDGFAQAFTEQGRRVDAVLVGEPSPSKPQRGPGALLRRLAFGLTLLAVVAGAGWLIYQATTSDDSDEATQPSTTAPNPATSPTPATTSPPPTTQPPASSAAPPTTSGGGLDLGDPNRLQAPTITVDGSVSLTGAVRAEATADRVRAAALVLAGDTGFDDNLVVDPDAPAWNEVRLAIPGDGLTGDPPPPVATRWAEAVVELATVPDATVTIRLDDPQQSEPLLAALADAGLDITIVEIAANPIDPGSTVVVVNATDA